MSETRYYVTTDGGFCAAYPHMIAAWGARLARLTYGETVMLRSVYEDGLTHVIIERPGDAEDIYPGVGPTVLRLGEWTYNNRGRDQEIYPDSGIPQKREEL